MMEKKWVYMIGATIWLMVQLGLFLLTPDQSQWVIPLSVLGGAGVAVAYLIPWAMLPDVIEYDEWETGQRREGMYYGFMVLLQKFGIAIAIFLIGQVLAWANYMTPSDEIPTPVQPESALFVIRLFIGPIPAVILACSLVVAAFYPITRARHAQLRAALDARRAQAEPV
jgi:GPH family glycoside/pentoside/hexuronide:cation symporter